MTYILSSDWHCHAWTQFGQTLASGINSRLNDILTEIRRQAQLADSLDAENIYVAGDVFHVRGSIKPSVFNPVARTLRECHEQFGVTFRIMPGNHDLESAETDELSSAITSLNEIPGVMVISKPTAFHDDKVVMVPWHNTRDGLSEAVEGVGAACEGGTGGYDLILHTGINGVIVGMPDHGWSPQELADFGFGRVFCGHYHHHKVFNIPDGAESFPVTSIGALTHQTWGDVGTRAGFLVVEEDGFELVESTAPHFIDYSEIATSDEVKGNFVRVRGIEMDEADIRAMREATLEAGAIGVMIEPLVKREATRPAVSTEESVTLERQIADYSEEHFKGLADEITKGALDVLSETRSAS
ncbi:MAG: hypothetical protein KI788_03940 [Mameliella sp.]|nr:hypothetical protein [Mameliella sp.]